MEWIAPALGLGIVLSWACAAITSPPPPPANYCEYMPPGVEMDEEESEREFQVAA